MRQQTIFEHFQEHLPKWNGPLNIGEFYGGIGAQHIALKNNGIVIGKRYLIEVDIEATISYALIHYDLKSKFEDHDFPSLDEIYDYLLPFNWWKSEKPYDIKRLSKKVLKQLYLAQQLTNNFGNVYDINEEELPKVDFITWSTPCQDFSLAGKGAGFDGHKGGLTFKTLDIFDKLKKQNKLPTFLLFENVPAIINPTHINGFNEMRRRLRNLGYENLMLKENACNFGICQNRDRVFIISVLKEYLKDYRIDDLRRKPLEITPSDLLLDGDQRDITDKISNRYFEQTQKENFEEYFENAKIRGNDCIYKVLDLYKFEEMKQVFQLRSRLIPTITTRNFSNYNFKFEYNNKIWIGSPRSAMLGMGFNLKNYNDLASLMPKKVIYKVAGNSIHIGTLEAIFEVMFLGGNS